MVNPSVIFRAFCTVIFFPCVFLNKLGVIIFAEEPLIHDEVQNKAVTMHVVTMHVPMCVPMKDDEVWYSRYSCGR